MTPQIANAHLRPAWGASSCQSAARMTVIPVQADMVSSASGLRVMFCVRLACCATRDGPGLDERVLAKTQTDSFLPHSAQASQTTDTYMLYMFHVYVYIHWM